MAKFQCVQGATSQSVNVFVRDSSSGIGAGLASIAPAGGSLLSGTKLDYSFTGANAARVNVALAVLATVGAAYSSAGIVQIDNTNMIGWVRVDIPNAALVGSSGRIVSFLLWGGTNMAPTAFEIELTATNNQSATAFITGVNSLAPPTNWNLFSIDGSGVAKANLAQILGTALTETAGLLAGGFKKLFNVVTPTGTLNSLPDAVPGATNGLLIAGSNAAATVNITGNLTGNVTGSVGSVTGLTASNLDTTVSSRLAPTVAARTLDVSAGGEAGVDWANVGSPTTTVGLTGTTVDLVNAPNATALTAIGTSVWATTTRTLSSFGTLVADVATAVWGAVSRTITGGTVTTATNLTNAPTNGDFTTAMKSSLDASTPAVGSITGDVNGKVLGGGASPITGNGVKATLDLTQAIPTSNTAETLGDALNAARSQGFGKWTIVGTTLTIFAADGTTVVRTFTLAPALGPFTSRT